MILQYRFFLDNYRLDLKVWIFFYQIYLLDLWYSNVDLTHISSKCYKYPCNKELIGKGCRVGLNLLHKIKYPTEELIGEGCRVRLKIYNTKSNIQAHMKSYGVEPG